ncbi:MAG: hypothetical protein EA405_04865 [Rhodospirillales bacterium]|nr:MAG: hypothetical protein EA405_04865 [Rhodospirillales bacterium]
MDMLATPRRRCQALAAHEYATLFWVAPPLAVLALANVLFELVGYGYAPVATALAAAETAPASLTGNVSPHRAAVGWGAAALLYLVVGAGAAVAAWRMLSSRVTRQARRPFEALAVAITVLGLGHLLAVDALDRPLSAIFHVTHEALAAQEILPSRHMACVALVVGTINVMSVLVPALLLAAAAATGLPPLDGWNATTLTRRARQVREFVAIAAAFMVAGVVHMGAWTHWAAATLTENTHQAALQQLATGITLYWGTTFTLMIASFYLPMAAVLSGLAANTMNALDVKMDERPAWLAAHGLSFQIHTQLPQIAAMAAPLLAGPLATAIRATTEHAPF